MTMPRFMRELLSREELVEILVGLSRVLWVAPDVIAEILRRVEGEKRRGRGKEELVAARLPEELVKARRKVEEVDLLGALPKGR